MRRLILCEAAPKVRAALAGRFAGHGVIEVRSPDEVAGLPAASLDVAVLHSVAQYLAPDELDRLLLLFRRLLRPGGLFILGDIIPPDVSAATDAMALLRFAGANGFFIAALLGLARTVMLTGLLAPALEPRAHALQRSRGDREARRRRFRGAARGEEYRPQPGAHDVPGAAEG